MGTGENLSNITDFFALLNTMSSGSVGWVALVVVFFVAFIGMKDYDTARAFVAAMFITALSSLMLNWLGLVTTAWMVGSVVVLVIAVIWVALQNQSS